MTEAKDKSKFPSQSTTYRDTRGTGGISIRGFYLETDEQGFIEGPLDIASEIAPHGFLPEQRPAADEQPKKKK